MILFTIAVLFFSFSALAQTPIYVENFSFEEPGTIKQLNFEDVPGWYTDSLAVDSGVETGWTPTDGEWTAFLNSFQPFVWQLTDHTIVEGDNIDLLVDARITWAALSMEMFLWYDDNGTKVFTAVEEYELTETMGEYGVNFNTAFFPLSIGKKLGIGFNNTTQVEQTWVGLDNVRLLNYNTAAVESQDARPLEFSLAQNYPNPFNPNTQIRYTLAKSAAVTIDVYDIFGHQINRLLQQQQAPGEYAITWDGRDFQGRSVASGLYICTMSADQIRNSIKMILQK